MYLSRGILAVAVLVSGVSASSASASSTFQVSLTSSTTGSLSTSTGSPCAIISSQQSSVRSAYPTATWASGQPAARFHASTALACLQSVPLDFNKSMAFVDWISPFLEFQSTLAYLKDPPTGYLLPGIDIFAGLDTIKQNLQSGFYQNQWSFEVDLYNLVEIRPHDFHLNLPMPLMGIFSFQTFLTAVSISSDGLSIPQTYLKDDLDLAKSTNTTSWEPSAIVSINGITAADYLSAIAEKNSDFQDPDAIYNQLFYSIPFNFQNGGNLFNAGGYTFGFDNDTTIYQFANGSTKAIPNVAVTFKDFTNITSGLDLFNAFEIPTTTSAAPAAATSAPPIESDAPVKRATVTMPGYPQVPVAIHPEGYTAGYFLDNTTAVLVMTAFASSNDSNIDANSQQQQVIENFLAACKAAGMTNLIVDVSANGGGSVFNGYDAFKQLFPSLTPFGGSRYRDTPAVNYLGSIFTTANVYNESFSSAFQTQSELDVNLQHFSNWDAMAGPFPFHGDNFTAELRYNFSDPVQQSGNHIIVSGYLNRSNIAPQLFASENVVLLYDGSCGSTCTIFAELMKSQGNVRSVVTGGRPSLGPMQGVAGSKGSQVFTVGNIQYFGQKSQDGIQLITSEGGTVPTLPSPQYVFSGNAAPLGNKLQDGARFNLRNAYHDGDTTQTPLQFVYEASNCRLFYKKEDIYDISGLWSRVADVVWGNGTCVPGSTVNSNNSISLNPYDTVPYSPAVMSTVQLPAGPGSLNTTTSTPPSNSTSTTGLPRATATNSATGLRVGSVVLLGAAPLLFACL